MKNESVFDRLTKGLGDAIADIREKVIEEGWFGRVVNERQPAWPQSREAQPEAGKHEHDLDMDR